jgi:hypothetical protein
MGYSFNARGRKVPLTNELAAGLQTTAALPVHPWSVQCGCSRDQLSYAQIFGGRLATVGDNIEHHGLTFAKAAHTRPFDSADMDKDVLPAIRGLNKSKAFLAIEPLHNSLIHRVVLSDSVHVGSDARLPRRQSRFIDFGEGSETCAPVSNEAKRPSHSASIENNT